MIFIEVVQVAEHGSPHVLDFGAGLPANTCTVVLANIERLLFQLMQIEVIYLARSARLCRRPGGSAGAGGAGVGPPHAAGQEGRQGNETGHEGFI